MTTAEMIKYDEMVEWGIATAEELNLARCLMSGTWEDVLHAVCYVRTGYHTLEDYIEDEMEDDCNQDDCGFDPYMGCYSYDC